MSDPVRVRPVTEESHEQVCAALSKCLRAALGAEVPAPAFDTDVYSEVVLREVQALRRKYDDLFNSVVP